LENIVNEIVGLYLLQLFAIPDIKADEPQRTSILFFLPQPLDRKLSIAAVWLHTRPVDFLIAWSCCSLHFTPMG
jgi:hypothetical protein